MIHDEKEMDRIDVVSQQSVDHPLTSTSSTESTLHTPTKHSHSNLIEKNVKATVTTNNSLKKYASTPALPFSSTPAPGFRSVANLDSSVRIPIVGYEVMEERARFTVYKIRIENKEVGDSWFIFRRYTDFARLHSKLKGVFPNKVLVLPRKRWFGNNFSLPFIEERIQGLQSFINNVTNDKELIGSQIIREFFCLDEPPSYSEIGEESRAIFDALEDTIYHLRKQLKAKETEIIHLRTTVTGVQEDAVTILEKLKESVTCDTCSETVQVLTEDLQRLLCIQFFNACY